MTSDNNNNNIAMDNLYNIKLPFPFKLHDMLSDVVQNNTEDIVSWQPHGKAFRVHKPKEFTQTIMLRYFRQTRYKSFQRQLHIYGFRRIIKGLDQGAYYHPMFRRGMETISLQMTRCKIKGALAKVAVEDPDFYQGISYNENVGAAEVLPDAVKKASSTGQQVLGGDTMAVPVFSMSALSESALWEEDGDPLILPSQARSRDPARQLPQPQMMQKVIFGESDNQIMLQSDFEPRPFPPSQNRRGSIFGEGGETFFAGRKFFIMPNTTSFPLSSRSEGVERCSVWAMGA